VPRAPSVSDLFKTQRWSLRHRPDYECEGTVRASEYRTSYGPHADAVGH
jgi:hypothetical protein